MIRCADPFPDTDNYYLAFPKDRITVKIMVYSVVILELAQTAISSYDIYLSLTAPYIPGALPVDAVQQHWLTVPIFGALSRFCHSLKYAVVNSNHCA